MTEQIFITTNDPVRRRLWTNLFGTAVLPVTVVRLLGRPIARQWKAAENAGR